MIKDCLIEKDKLMLYVHRSMVIYTNKKGEVHQGVLLYFTDDVATWKHLP